MITFDELRKILIEAEIQMDFDEKENVLSINLEGPEMGILIGKRGQTLDALQYIITLAINKKSESRIRVKLDTENYRARRKETLENLAKNIAFKVKRSKRSFALEPMNPYERRIIHATLQNDKYVATRRIGNVVHYIDRLFNHGERKSVRQICSRKIPLQL